MKEFRESFKTNARGILLILLSSVFVAVGQLFWKLWNGNLAYFLIIGFVLYILGAITMVIAFRYGKFSVIHPMLTFSYVLAIVLGYWVLDENMSADKLMGIFCIIGGGDS